MEGYLVDSLFTAQDGRAGRVEHSGMPRLILNATCRRRYFIALSYTGHHP